MSERERGNAHFRNKRYREAAAAYTEAIQLSLAHKERGREKEGEKEEEEKVKEGDKGDEGREGEREGVSELHVLYSNRAAAYLALRQWDLAAADAEMCVCLAPQWAKV